MAGSTANSPEVLREIVQNVLVKPLEDRSVILGSGVRVFDTDGSPVRVPKLNDDTSEPEFVAESAEIPDTYTPDFSEVLLMPRTLRGVKEISRFSNELMRQSVVSIEATIRERLVRRVTTKIDGAMIDGDGAPDGDGNRTEPQGMLSWQGTQAMPSVGALSIDTLHDAVGLAMGADVNVPSLRWMMRSDTFVGLRKLKASGTGEYLVQPDVTQAGAFTLLGHPVIVTNRIPEGGTDPDATTSVVLADMSTVAVARDTNPTVAVLSERYAEYDEIGVRVTTRYDAQPLLPEAVVVLRGVSA